MNGDEQGLQVERAERARGKYTRVVGGGKWNQWRRKFPFSYLADGRSFT